MRISVENFCREFLHENCVEFLYSREILLKELLKKRGIMVQRSRLKGSIHRVEEAGVSLRKNESLKGECIKLKRQINYGIMTPIINW